MPLASWGQSDLFVGKVIRSIRFEPEQQPLPEAELRAILPVKPGDRFSRIGVRQMIAELYKTNRFDGISVEGEAAGPDVDLLIRTTVNWFMGRVVIRGVPDPPTGGQLNNSTKLELGTTFEPGQINQASEGLANTLRF